MNFHALWAFCWGLHIGLWARYMVQKKSTTLQVISGCLMLGFAWPMVTIAMLMDWRHGRKQPWDDE